MSVHRLRPSRRHGLLSATSAALMAFAPAVASAEDVADAEDAVRDTIVVTGARKNQTGSGTKTGTPLMETPQSITIIDNEELTRRNALSINQAMAMSPASPPTSAATHATPRWRPMPACASWRACSTSGSH